MISPSATSCSYGKMNPDFFKGTVAEKEAQAELARVAGVEAKAA